MSAWDTSWFTPTEPEPEPELPRLYLVREHGPRGAVYTRMMTKAERIELGRANPTATITATDPTGWGK